MGHVYNHSCMYTYEVYSKNSWKSKISVDVYYLSEFKVSSIPWVTMLWEFINQTSWLEMTEIMLPYVRKEFIDRDEKCMVRIVQKLGNPITQRMSM